MIRKATLSDVHAVAELAGLLWEGSDHEDSFRELLSRNDCAVYLAECRGTPVGFAQCQLRHDYVEGTDTNPVGYLEGIYVRPGFREQGIARALLCACEEWAAVTGATEFASDCELTNETSLLFHLKMGFIEANRIICFTKKL